MASRLIVALDYPEATPALNMATALRGTSSIVKVGLELFTREGPEIVRRMRALGLPVMLDLKFHDIPNTVKGCVRAACAMDVDILTLHLAGGERMIRAAVEGAKEGEAAGGKRPLLFAVTVLTSLADGELPGVGGNLSAFAVELAGMGARWGLDGVVCSGHEVAKIKSANPGLLCLTPGIRPAANRKPDDQRRTMTPAEAVAAGSDFLVVGRPVTQAADPASAARSVLAEMKAGDA